MDTASTSLGNKPLKETEEPLDGAFPGPGCDQLATVIQSKQQTHISWCHVVLGKSRMGRSLPALWQKCIFCMTIHVFLKHYLLYEFILLLHKWLQSFNHFSFEPAQKLNRLFSVHIFPKNYIPIAVDFRVHQSYLSLSSSVKINLSLNLDSALFSHQNLWVFFLCSGLKSNRV